MGILKTKKIRREWGDALRKMEREGRCRFCGSDGPLETAHVIGREADAILTGPKGGKYRYVHPDSVVPLCGQFSVNRCHPRYDARQIDLLPSLYWHEQARGVEDAQGVINFLKRVSPQGGTW